MYLIPVHSPHICYTFEGERFHGDCEADRKGNEQKHHCESSRLYSKNYVCYDVINGSGDYYHSKKLTIKNHTGASICHVAVKLIVVPNRQDYFSVPETRCNTGPPLLSNLLRAPPVC